MKKTLKGAGAISAVVLAVGLAMCWGGGAAVSGWLLGYMTALAVVSLGGLWAWASE